MYVLLGNTYFLKNTYNIWTRYSINEVILENYSHAIPAYVLVPYATKFTTTLGGEAARRNTKHS